MAETVTNDEHEYVETAVLLADDWPRLAALRAELRARMARSPLCDGRRFADNFLKVLRGAWRDRSQQV
jgi:predicted O-linked N-acetylglucosamine transferase (SPINDLY family)